jgi:transposase
MAKAKAPARSWVSASRHCAIACEPASALFALSIRALREEVAQMKARIEGLLALVATQQVRIEILERASGSDPSGPSTSPPAIESQVERMPRGRRPGHPGTSWSLPAIDPQIVELRLSRYPDCGGALSRRFDVQEHTVVDLPEKNGPVVTKYRYQRRYSARCRKSVRAPLAPNESAQGHFGLRLLTRIAEWKTRVGIPFTKIHDLLASVFQFEILRSKQSSIVTRVGRWLLPVRRRLIEEMKAAPVKYADETTWPVNGRDGWRCTSRPMTSPSS